MVFPSFNFEQIKWREKAEKVFCAILNMNPKIGNIVVKDIDDDKIDVFFVGKSA
jgi:Ethanolamine utilization protein EutJ (predicted chaperonin)